MKNRTTSFRVWTWHTYDNYGSSLSSNPVYELKDNTNAENVNADLRDIKYRIDEETYTLVGADDRNFTAESLRGVDRTDLQGNELEMEKEYVAAIDNFDHSYYTYSTFGVNEHGDKILESVAIRRRNEGVVGSYNALAGEEIHNKSSLLSDYYITADTWQAWSGETTAFNSANVKSFLESAGQGQLLRDDVELPIEDGQLIRTSNSEPYHSIDIETFKDDAGFYLPSTIDVISSSDVNITVPDDYVLGKRVDQQITIDGSDADTYTLNLDTISDDETISTHLSLIHI